MTQEEKIFCAMVNAVNDTFKNWVIISDLDVDDNYKADVCIIEEMLYDCLESMQNLMIIMSQKIMGETMLDRVKEIVNNDET